MAEVKNEHFFIFSVKLNIDYNTSYTFTLPSYTPEVDIYS